MKTKKLAGASADVSTALQWLKLNDAVRLFGLSRSTLYLLMKMGKIKSSQICPADGKRGTRLIEFASLKAFIEFGAQSVEKSA
ncbi:MAG: helix-turn-helix domain-containing protein [Chthoniobacteraceae bacterium]